MRMKGLEPIRLAACAPETHASAYSATSAHKARIYNTLLGKDLSIEKNKQH